MSRHPAYSAKPFFLPVVFPIFLSQHDLQQFSHGIHIAFLPGYKVIGGDAPILDSQVPVRQVLEQIVAKTSIPPFMLGLNWNSTERMSAQQADMLTTEITAIRRTLTPVVEQICRMWLRMQGETAAFRVDWEDINLQDEVEEAKAELYREQARKLRIENDAAEGKIEDRAAGAAKKA